MFWYGGFWRLRLGITGLVLGGMLLFFGFHEWQLGTAASAQPEDLTLEALIARGPNGNPNIRVRDFMLGDNFTYFTDDTGTYWTDVLVPAVPKTMGEQSAHVLIPKVIVRCKHVANEDQLDQLYGRTQLEGMVVNRIESLGSDEKNFLLKDYPDIDFDTCIILEEGRKPSNSAMLFLMGGGGLALLLGGGWLLLYNFNRT
ncbi:MAG TPA: hypothetical protein VMS17_06925 [Gemmataceae bacterium]|nr:hypothetical protein [Gemmataceae bacterium]